MVLTVKGAGGLSLEQPGKDWGVIQDQGGEGLVAVDVTPHDNGTYCGK